MKNTDIIVRKASQGEELLVFEIFSRIQKEEFPWVSAPMSFEDFKLSIEGEDIYAALIGEKIIGFVSVWRQDSFIHNLFVKKQFRRAGAGKALLEYAIKELGGKAFLKCVVENKDALRFYADGGWKKISSGESKDGVYFLMSYGEKL